MCGRFVFEMGFETILEFFENFEINIDPKPNYNITPKQKVVTITNQEPARMQLFHWGLIPPWAKDKKFASKLINARAETLSEKPTFKKSYQTKRCLILANGYYEWQKKTKIPLYIRLKSQQPFAFAGLWETWNPPGQEPVNSCTIITTEPNELLKSVHHRMPVILNLKDYSRWLDTNIQAADELDDLLVPYASNAMEYYAVSDFVNNARNNSPQCIQPVT